MGLDQIAEMGARNVLITTDFGCFALLREERTARRYRVEAPQLEPVSAVGAGDTLLAAFVAAHVAGRPREDALRAGVAAGRCVDARARRRASSTRARLRASRAPSRSPSSRRSPVVSLRGGIVSGWTSSSFGSLSELALPEKFAKEGLTFDDVLLVPADSAVLPNEVSTATRLTRTIALELPLVVGGDGHGHRGAHGDRACPARRPRRPAPQPLDRRSDRRDRQGQALRIGDDRRAADAAAGCARRRRARADGELPASRAFRSPTKAVASSGSSPTATFASSSDTSAAGLCADDVEGPRHRARRHDARRRRAAAASPPHREASGRRRRTACSRA